jgi:hypothetical protein
MLCNLKKKGNSDTCYNMDEPREYYTVMVWISVPQKLVLKFNCIKVD